MEKVEIKPEDDYGIIKEKLKTIEDGKYKSFILEKEDIQFKYGYAIYDVESKDKNKPLDAIAICSDLYEDYEKSCRWLLQNTNLFPGLLRLDLKLFIIASKLRHCIMISPYLDVDIPFEYIENKEDGILNCITIKYSRDKFSYGNIGKAVDYYFDLNKIKNNLKEANTNFQNSLKEVSTIEFKID